MFPASLKTHQRLLAAHMQTRVTLCWDHSSFTRESGKDTSIVWLKASELTVQVGQEKEESTELGNFALGTT